MSFSKFLANRSLVSILTVPFVLQIGIAVAVVGYISFRNGQEAVNDVAKQLRQEITLRIAEKLSNYTEIPHGINEINAGALLRGEIDPIGGTKGEELLFKQVSFFAKISYVYCGTEAGGEFFGVGRVGKDSPLELAITNNTLTKSARHYYNLSPNGKRSNLKKVLNQTYDSRKRPWYIAAVEEREATWSEIYLDFDTLLPTITASLPVYSNSQTLMGVCAADFFLPNEMSDFMSKLEIGKTGIAFIVERTGKLVATSSPEPTTTGTGEQTERLLANASSNSLIKATAENLIVEFQSLDRIQETTKLEFFVDRSRYFVQIQPFSNKRNLDWLIISVIPEADFMTQINQNLVNTIWLSILTLMLVGGGGIVTARWLSRPIFQLAIASNALAQGELDQNVKIEGSQEILSLQFAFNQMAEQLRQSFSQLEERVKERTQELEIANHEVIVLTKKLQAENLRLSSELAITQKIQQMILPKMDELLDIPDLDIAGYMQPANEVGGDYYDVLNEDGIITVAIGDVTGHGLESGILMLMTQTAVRTLREHQESNPISLLKTINRTIYKNIIRMNSDKNLTLALLNYTQNRLFISGQHEEIIVVRADRQLERIDTINLGFPIGLELDVDNLFSHQEIILEPGDGVVIYTDGITEAENPLRQQYGLDNLCMVIQEKWHLPAEGVVNAVIDNLRSFIGSQVIYDDITLVILKQK